MRERDAPPATATVTALRVLTPESARLLRYARSYPGRPDQVREVRAFLREVLAGWPRADDAVALASELAANACLHSRSGVPGGVFTLRAEVSEGDCLYVAVEDQGGPWDLRACAVLPEHGLDLVQAIAGPGEWGITGGAAGRVVWARLAWPGSGQLVSDPIKPEATMPIRPAADDTTAELEKLALELAARGVSGQLVTPEGRLPYLDVHATEALRERIYAQGDWYFWPHAERIAACDDLASAADTIARVLRAGGGLPGA